ncbi:NADP-dependent oxidoreductase [Aspergillus undulatus]|uniref:NADP-dependent oxidoreductase n=1 Tax=Aspergillus undulatus TaxID=1810928 RepID=UPI003CCE258B
MQAIRLHPAPPGEPPYTPSNPAPTSALHLETIPIPKPINPREILIKITSSTIIRDTLTWPELYNDSHPLPIPGNDLSGTVVEVYPTDSHSRFKPGDEVFGMLPADRPGAWAEYVVVREGEIARKPKDLSWGEAAALPLSGLTAYEALFEHASVSVPSDEEVLRNSKRDHSTPRNQTERKNVLITGAAGAVGTYIVQLARLAGLDVTGATSSNDRNAEFLLSLGADETIEYSSLDEPKQGNLYDIIIDTVGGKPLEDSWRCIKDNGTLITVDSSSFNFIADHKERGIYKEGVKALFFIVQGGSNGLDTLAGIADLGLLRVFVLDVYPLDQIREAYGRANGRLSGRGKIILSIS